ncbi:hypothetical protein [Brevibacillus dissolubilis]|uniref:hypothetical protein n=1 Tax=Brevibacillus dissolubilis TaxID=1844116 RepID=UPI0011165141|nr:hypothetical protein [Brevibacillus dissolubilis]
MSYRHEDQAPQSQSMNDSQVSQQSSMSTNEELRDLGTHQAGASNLHETRTASRMSSSEQAQVSEPDNNPHGSHGTY